MFTHYLDGYFIHYMFNLLAVMMIYKYYDAATTEDLEFVGGNAQEKRLIDHDIDYRG